ncbi:hypothetical protein [Micromonospora sp. NPDC049801]
MTNSLAGVIDVRDSTNPAGPALALAPATRSAPREKIAPILQFLLST